MKLSSINNPVLFEINTAVWLSALSARAGRRVTLGSVPEMEWDLLRDLGVDIVWLMGVWQRSEESRKRALSLPELRIEYGRACPDWNSEDVIGSPYAVRQYTPEPRFGNWDDLRIARQELADRKIGLILDLVPNHTALDHPWATTNAGFYIEGSAEQYQQQPGHFREVPGSPERRVLAHGRDPYFPPWTDTFQLNYRSTELRREWIQIIRRLSEFCDGFRCDMAMLGLNRIFETTWGRHAGGSEPATEFWGGLLADFGQLIWLAECYWETQEELLSLGFDYAYDKELLDHLCSGDHGALHRHLREIGPWITNSVHFLENHDEDRGIVAVPSLQAASVVTYTLPGMKLIHQGQIRGAEVRVPVQLGRARIEPQQEGLEDFYGKVLCEIKKAPFQEGHWSLCENRSLSHDSQPFVACQWSCREEIRRLIVANLSQERRDGHVRLQGVKEGRTYRFKECVADQVYWRHGEELVGNGLHVILEPGMYHLLEVTPETVLP